MTALALQHCRPLTGAPLTAAEQAPLLAQVPDWVEVDGALQRAFGFDDFASTMAFVNAVAWLAQREDHHPDMQLSWGRCVLRWHTHSVGGLSINDYICAARVDAMLP
jgi:4a-hydroxytetrahydrobiopterin dehydratase